MRYQNDSKRVRRAPRGKSTKPPAEVKCFATDATVMTPPKHECSIFRGSEIREEVSVEVILHTDSWSPRYLVRFTNKHVVEKAKKLRCGDKIHICRGRFEKRYKRKESELRIAEFTT